MLSNSRILILITVSICAFAAIIAGFYVARLGEDEVEYHKRKMNEAFKERFAQPSFHKEGLFGYEEGEATIRFEHHRDQLIALGAAIKFDYRFHHIQRRTDEGRDLAEHIMTNMTEHCIDFASEYPRKPEPFQITVWCYTADKSEWDHLIATRDVPDYRETFLTE